MALLGAGHPDLTEATEALLRRAAAWPVPDWPVVGSAAAPSGGRLLRGLFVGGTLASEARIVATGLLGADAGTRSSTSATTPTPPGRAHPMIDPTLRLEHLGRAAADPDTAVAAARRRPRPRRRARPGGAAGAGASRRSASRSWSSSSAPPTDPQGLDRQVRALADAGAEVHLSNARRHPPRGRAHRRRPADEHPEVVVNVGADLLADAVDAQAVPVTRVDWRPPMEGTEARPRHRRPPTRAGRRPTRGPSPRCSRSPPPSSTSSRPSEAARPGAGPVPARRPADRVGARVRPAARRADGRRRARGAGRRPRGRRRALRVRHVGLARAVPPPLDRRPDGRRRHAEHVAVGPRGRGQRAAYLLLAQRGARQGAALRRLRARGPDPAALDERRARPAAAVGGARHVETSRARSTSPGSSPRCSRWATRPTTATAPAR